MFCKFDSLAIVLIKYLITVYEYSSALENNNRVDSGTTFNQNGGHFRCFAAGRQGLCMTSDECVVAARGTPLGQCAEGAFPLQQCCLIYDLYDNSGIKYECGVAKEKFTRRGKIVNGSIVRYAEFPWQVYITINSYRRNACGGTLISPDWVVTAAHCIVGNHVDKIHVLLGKHNLTSAIEPYPYQVRSVSHVVIHQNFNFNRGGEYDVALLRLDGRVDFAPNVIPICLPNSQADFTNRMGIVTGWGKTAWNEPVSPVLRMVALPILSQEDCQKSVLGYHSSFLCAGYMAGGQDSCDGDSGGPLQIYASNRRFYLAGIVSSGGSKCAEKGVIGIYSNVPSFVDWIKYTIQNCLAFNLSYILLKFYYVVATFILVI